MSLLLILSLSYTESSQCEDRGSSRGSTGPVPGRVQSAGQRVSLQIIMSLLLILSLSYTESSQCKD